MEERDRNDIVKMFVYGFRSDFIRLSKNLDIVVNAMAGSMLKNEFSKPLQYPATTGYIDVVSVAENYRQMGLASKLLGTVISQTEYNEYILDVIDSNNAAQKNSI